MPQLKEVCCDNSWFVSGFEYSVIRGSPTQLDDEMPPRTFADILPPELVTTSSLSNGAAPPSSSRFSRISKPSTGSTSSSKQSQTASAQRLVDTVRRSALPKMQGVVSDLRRSVTSMRRNKNKPSPSRFNVDAKQGTSTLSAGSYTRFADEDGDEASEGGEGDKTRRSIDRSVSHATLSQWQVRIPTRR